MLTARALTDMYNYWEQQTFNANNRIINQVCQNLFNELLFDIESNRDFINNRI